MKKVNLLVEAILIALIVITTIVLHIFSPDYRNLFIGFIIGALMCVAAASIMIDSYHCKIKVTAVLMDYGFEQYKAHITSSPVFSYSYQGKSYTETSRESLSQRYVLKHYKEGQTYNIYISTKDPTCIKLTRRIRMFELVMFIIGLFIVALSIYALFFII